MMNERDNHGNGHGQDEIQNGHDPNANANVQLHQNGRDDEIQFLKDSVIRLTKELLSHQNKINHNHHSDDGNDNITKDGINTGNDNGNHNHHGKHNDAQPEAAAIEGIELPPWMLEASIMSPLFLAYDARIEDLSVFIEQQGEQACSVSPCVYTNRTLYTCTGRMSIYS